MNPNASAWNPASSEPTTATTASTSIGTDDDDDDDDHDNDTAAAVDADAAWEQTTLAAAIRGAEVLTESCVESVHQSKAVRAVDLYRLGLAFSGLNQLNSSRSIQNILGAVPNAYHRLLGQLSLPFRSQLFDQLLQGLERLVIQAQKKQTQKTTTATNVEEELVLAIQAIACLYQASPLAGTLAHETIQSLIATLTDSYITTTTQQKQQQQAPLSSSSSSHLLPQSILVFWSCLLLLGDHAICENLELLRQVVDLWQQPPPPYVAWNNLCRQLDQQYPWWRQRILQTIEANNNDQDEDDHTQRDYWVSLLSVEEENKNDENGDETNNNSAVAWKDPEVPTTTTAKPKTAAPVVPNDPIQPFIDQLREFFPHLGEGFCETALALYHNNVEQTVDKLLLLDTPEAMNQLPTPLLVADRNLPRRHRTNTAQKAIDEETEAKQVAKLAWQATEDRERAQARQLQQAMTTSAREIDEYDDDYDDQWDDGGFGTVTTDIGLYDKDDDYTAVKTYNRVYRELEAEDQFWSANRNTNRTATAAKAKSTTSGEKSYRGPDKGRGGRIIHTFGRGSGVPIPSNDDDEEEDGNRKTPAGRGGRGGSGRGRGNKPKETSAPTANENPNNNNSGGRGGRGGRGEARGRGGGRGTKNSSRGAGAGRGNTAAAGETASSATTSGGGGGGRGGRGKERALAKRREQQKNAMYKKSG